jgi:LPXTG-motif cell wall-anchored protein
VDPASAVPGALAHTGADVAALSLLGALLLLAGIGATVLARRKGVHA